MPRVASFTAIEHLVEPGGGGGGGERQGQPRYGGRMISSYRQKLVAAPGGAHYPLRLLGEPLAYVAHQPTVGKIARPFPDGNEAHRTRCCTDDGARSEGRASHCPWCCLHFRGQERYLFNCLLLSPEGADHAGNPEVRFIDLTWWGYQHLYNLVRSNPDMFPDGPGSLTQPVPNIEIIVTGSPNFGTGGPPIYSIIPVGQPRPLSEHAIAAIGRLNQDAASTDRMRLHDLHQLCRPSLMSAQLQIELFGKVIDAVPGDANGNGGGGEFADADTPDGAAPAGNIGDW